mmetsp:Transcript_96464/g.251457  ORF Transcript_96464/g.251457 Transcript_96464/m.251457 type:complete len:262 (+) Transcript_96464:349-1134(+)
MKHVLAAVDHVPGEHRRREAVDATRRVLPRRGALVDDAQPPLGAVVEPDAPVEELALHDAPGRDFHGAAHVLHPPLAGDLDVRGSLPGLDLAHVGDLLPTPLPLLGLPQQVAGRVQLSVLQAEADHLLRVRVGGHEMAGRPEDIREQFPGNLQERALHRRQHVQEVSADKLADFLKHQRVLGQDVVLEGSNTVLLRQAWLLQLRRDVVLVQRLDVKLLCQHQEVEGLLWGEVGLKAPEIHEAHHAAHHLVLVVQLDCVMIA